MSILRFSIAPLYNSVYVASRDLSDVPYNFDEVTIPSTPDCVSIPTQNWGDGETVFEVGEASEIALSTAPAFDGMLNTPDMKLLFFDANVDNFATIPLPTARTRIRVWIDHPREPEHVVVAWG